MAALKASIRLNWAAWLCSVAAFGFIAFVIVGSAYAADKAVPTLGGDCCADLEGRIAELEATTARKGNRKITVEISGVIDKGVLWYDIGGTKDYSVGENSNDPSYLQIAGKARVSPSVLVGYVLQVGVGGYQGKLDPIGGNFGYGHFDGDTNGIYIRKSFFFVDTGVGKFAAGKLSQASDEIMNSNTSNAGVASTPLSLRPLVGPSIGEALDIFDGGRTNAVRYDSPLWYGLQVSASFAAASTDSGGDTNGSIWDVAIRWVKDLGSFKVNAGAAYRDGVVLDTDGQLLGINFGSNLGDVKVISGSASVMHIPTGIFLTAAAGTLDFSKWASGASDLKGWSVQGGVEERWNSLGHTTLFAERGEWDLGGGTKPTYWGAGLVQSVDAAATDFYLSGRRYETDGLLGGSNDVGTVVMGGAKVKF